MLYCVMLHCVESSLPRGDQFQSLCHEQVSNTMRKCQTRNLLRALILLLIDHCGILYSWAFPGFCVLYSSLFFNLMLKLCVRRDVIILLLVMQKP